MSPAMEDVIAGCLEKELAGRSLPLRQAADAYDIFVRPARVGSEAIWGCSVGDRRGAPILATIFAEVFASISPDGKWMAYQSDESGRNEVYVQSFDGQPHWRSDGGELLYMKSDGHITSLSIRVGADGGLESGQPQTLFQTRPVPKFWNLYDAAPDGQRFLMNIPLEWTSALPITVVTNWTEKLKE